MRHKGCRSDELITFDDVLYGPREGKILLGNPACIMCIQPDLKGIVNIVPVWMVVLYLAFKGDTGHDRKGLFEIPEFERGLDGTVVEFPSRQGFQPFFNFLGF